MVSEPPKTDPKAWGEYFAKKLEAQRLAEAEAESAEEVLEIIQPSRAATFSDLNTSVKNLIARLTVAGFWSAAQVTVVRQVGTLIKSGEKEGQMRPDKEITNVFIHAAHPDKRYLTCWYRDSKLENAQIRDGILEKMGEVEDYVGS